MFRSSAVALTIFSALVSQLSLASVTVFQGPKITHIQSEFSLSDSSFKAGSGDLNKGMAAQSFLGFVKENKGTLGLKQVDGESLPFSKATQTEESLTLRFRQRHHRVAIEGAEILGIFSADGSLEAINSSIAKDIDLSVTPEITREAARAVALAFQQYSDPVVEDNGLLIVRENDGTYALVWKLMAYEKETAEGLLNFEVYASGARKGEIRKALSAVHAANGPKIKIYDAPLPIGIPSPLYRGVYVSSNGKDTLWGKLFRKNAPSEAVQSADEAYVSLKKVVDYFKNEFNRNSYDGQGAVVRASVNVKRKGMIDLLGFRQNAAWMGPFKQFIFGAGGDELGDFTKALDVVGHEFTHAVIGTTSNLAYESQSGALNEHLADVFGAIIEQQYENGSRPFLIGDTVLKGNAAIKAQALRDMEEPGRGLQWQPSSVSQIPAELGSSCVPSGGNDNCGVHTLSGIPNRMAAKVIRALGWDKGAKLFYQVMTSRLREKSDFADYRNQLLAQCSKTLNSSECGAVQASLNLVGM